MLHRPAFDFGTHDRLLAARLVNALLALRPAAGRPGRGRAARRSDRPALQETALALVRWARDDRPFGQGALATAGLSRTTIVRYLGIWSGLGLVARVDAHGRPVPHGTTTPPGEAALWRLETAWTPELVDLMPSHWRTRLELAWWAFQAAVPEELVGRCLRMVPACNGDRILRAALDQAERRVQRRARSERRACRLAMERAERRRAPSELAAWNWTPPETEHRLPPHDGPYGACGAGRLAPGSARARESRAANPPRRTEPSAEQYRRIVEAGLIQADTEGMLLYAELVHAAQRLGEDDPVSLFGAVVNLTIRRQLRLDDLVGRFCRDVVDQLLADIGDRVRSNQREPVGNPAAFAWRMLRYQVGDLPRPPRAGRPPWLARRAAPADQAADQVADEQLQETSASGDLPLYQREPEPSTERRSVEELRAIRARKLAEYQAARGRRE